MQPEWFSTINDEPTVLTKEMLMSAIEEIRNAPPKQLKLFTSRAILREALSRDDLDDNEKMRWIASQRGSFWDWV